MGHKQKMVQLTITQDQLNDIHFAILMRAAELVQQGKDAYDVDKWRSQQDRLDIMNSYFEHANQYHELARVCERVKQGLAAQMYTDYEEERK